MKTKVQIILNLLLITAFFLITWIFVKKIGLDGFLGFQFKGKEISWEFFTGITFSTFAGSMLGVIYDRLQTAENQEGLWWNIALDAIKSARFGSSLLVSPFVVYYVFGSVYDKELDLAVFITCFQSGFFWERTFKLATVK